MNIFSSPPHRHFPSSKTFVAVDISADKGVGVSYRVDVGVSMSVGVSYSVGEGVGVS